MSSGVVAVVVTFNRKILLSQCLDALLVQGSNLTRIVVVNNASTDGTSQFLEDGGYLARAEVEYHELDENIGGAGGFHFGLKRALAHDSDYFWLMDDDGRPGPSCLDKLLAVGGDVIAPLVVDVDDPSRTAFPYALDGGRTRDVQMLGMQSALSPVHPFNGVMISRAVVCQVGLPDESFFIWGDELDYRERWQVAGFAEQVVPAARFFHPSDRQVISRGNKWSIGVPIAASKLRKYCFYRNQLWLSRKRIGLFRSIVKVFLTLPDVVGSDPDRGVFMLAAVHGVLGVKDGHRRYIR